MTHPIIYINEATISFYCEETVNVLSREAVRPFLPQISHYNSPLGNVLTCWPLGDAIVLLNY